MNSLSHLAIIMDGNGRWAQLKNKPRLYGHIKGTRVAKQIITAASDQGIKYLTLYAFSSENWGRPPEEVSFLMRLLERYLRKETENLVKKNICFSTIGDLSQVPQQVRQLIDFAKQKTQKCTGLQVVFAIGYGFKSEMVEAVKKISQQVVQKNLSLEDISQQIISENLMTSQYPDPDLVIRTSGEKRLSNFLLWQVAYSELFFSEVLWPDFTVEDMNNILNDFQKRERRFGKLASNQSADQSVRKKEHFSVELNH
jgi:undecaprenyl diphosphate synthase